MLDFQLHIIRFLQSHFDNYYFVEFMKFCDHFDRAEFFFVLIPVIWFFFGRYQGLKIFNILFISIFVNHYLKQFFGLPRPYHLDPALGLVSVPGCGFPSGAAQTVILLSGLLIMYWKSKYRWPVAIFYTLTISFSRVYLGVHFITDILAGWLIGFLMLAIYFYIFPKVEKALSGYSSSEILLLNIVTFSLIMIFFPSNTYFCIGGIMLNFLSYILKRFKLSRHP